MRLKVLYVLFLVVGLGFQQTNAQSENLISNHNFADDFEGWILYGETAGEDFQLVDSPNDDGQMLEYFTGEHLDPGEGDNIELVAEMMAIEAGVEYTLRAYFRTWDGAADETVPANMKLRFWSEGEEEGEVNFEGEDFQNFPGSTEGDWQNLEITMVAPEGAELADVVFDTFGSAGDVETEVNIDAVYLTKAEEEEDLPAGNPDAEDNLVSNHNFVDDFEGWILYGETAGEDFQLVDSPNDDGQMVEYFTGEHLDPGEGDNIELVAEMMAIEAGLEYTLRAYFRTWDGAADETVPANMKLRFWSEGEEEGEVNFEGEDFQNFPGSTEGDWHNLDITMVAPEGAELADVVFDTFGSAGDVETEVNIDAVYLAETQQFTPTDVDREMLSDQPREFRIEQNYPNPFNPTTQIKFSIPEATNVSVDVYTIQGQHVATLIDGNLNAGVHEVSFDGSSLSSGMYLYRLQAGNYSEVRKMSLIK